MDIFVGLKFPVIHKGFCWQYERYMIVQTKLADKWKGPNDWKIIVCFIEGGAAVLGLCECFRQKRLISVLKGQFIPKSKKYFFSLTRSVVDSLGVSLWVLEILAVEMSAFFPVYGTGWHSACGAQGTKKMFEKLNSSLVQ